MSASSESMPPDPLDGTWFVHLNGKTHGPFSGHEIQKRIQQRQVSEETLFYAKGGSNWIRAKSDPVLGTLFKGPYGAPEQKNRHTRHRHKIVTAVGLLICAAVAWLVWPYAGWRLTRVSLPPGLLDHLPNVESDKKIHSANASTTSAASTAGASIQQPMEISLVSKGFKSANFRDRDYDENITFVLSIKNMTDKDVRAFDGTLTFTDLLGNHLLSSKLAINEVIGHGATLNWNGSIIFNQFMDSHKHLRNEAQDNLRLKFETRKILFTDGSTKEY